MADGKGANLQLTVPADLKRQLAVNAANDGVTIRALVLKALVDAGYKISPEELRDKRRG